MKEPVPIKSPHGWSDSRPSQHGSGTGESQTYDGNAKDPAHTGEARGLRGQVKARNWWPLLQRELFALTSKADKEAVRLGSYLQVLGGRRRGQSRVEDAFPQPKHQGTILQESRSSPQTLAIVHRG